MFRRIWRTFRPTSRPIRDALQAYLSAIAPVVLGADIWRRAATALSAYSCFRTRRRWPSTLTASPISQQAYLQSSAAAQSAFLSAVPAANQAFLAGGSAALQAYVAANPSALARSICRPIRARLAELSGREPGEPA